MFTPNRQSEYYMLRFDAPSQQLGGASNRARCCSYCFPELLKECLPLSNTERNERLSSINNQPGGSLSLVSTPDHPPLILVNHEYEVIAVAAMVLHPQCHQCA